MKKIMLLCSFLLAPSAFSSTSSSTLCLNGYISIWNNKTPACVEVSIVGLGPSQIPVLVDKSFNVSVRPEILHLLLPADSKPDQEVNIDITGDPFDADLTKTVPPLWQQHIVDDLGQPKTVISQIPLVRLKLQINSKVAKIEFVQAVQSKLGSSHIKLELPCFSKGEASSVTFPQSLRDLAN